MKPQQKLAVSGVVLLALVVGLLGAMRQQAVRPQGIRVVASFYPLGYFAEQIVGDLGTVQVVTPAGAEPHDYEPTPGDIASMHDADVVVLNGGGLETWGDDIGRQLEGQPVRIVQAGNGLVTKQVAEEDEGTVPDPHVWLDPVLAKQEAARIAETLAAADPAHAQQYDARNRQLAVLLDSIDTRYRQGLSACTTTAFVTSHHAFGYLAARYNLTQVGIAGLSPDEEPSPQQLADAATFVRERKIGTIFFESLVSPKLADTLAREVGVRTEELNPIEGLTPAQSAAGDTYETIMIRNLDHLKDALGCHA